MMKETSSSQFLGGPRRSSAAGVSTLRGTEELRGTEGPRNPQQILSEVDGLTGPQLDGLPFGAIQLDRDGTILQFNEYEANLSNRRAPDTVGANFFRDVAPCTNVREFYGRFRQGISAGELNVSFDYRFAFKQAPRDVRVTLFYSTPTATMWVFVQERSK